MPCTPEHRKATRGRILASAALFQPRRTRGVPSTTEGANLAQCFWIGMRKFPWKSLGCRSASTAAVGGGCGCRAAQAQADPLRPSAERSECT
jgi:hypothetical protein